MDATSQRWSQNIIPVEASEALLSQASVSKHIEWTQQHVDDGGNPHMPSTSSTKPM